ncbi:acyl-CoA Delta-9 desaturase [Bacillus rossius redtenbacheri]|uniref:acyl-CoA Delta-9 desaturase n=1 Tax=Bacillus rossius redtenbacheri TaxID=93214 RepID=UPI002FDD1312
MAPNVTSQPEAPAPCGNNNTGEEDKRRDAEWTPTIIWLNVVSIAVLHLLALESLIFLPLQVSPWTFLWGFFVGGVGGFGVTAGAHRLWTHRAYKARTPLRVLLAVCYSVAGQNTIFDWVRDHRVHHKFSETDADPHNSKRGFFFAHVGWLMVKKHPEVIRRGRQIDMTDILEDPVVAFHTKYFTELKLLFCFILPAVVPPCVWGESWYNSVMGLCVVRYVSGLNFTWLVNSAAHIWGTRPFDKRISPAENAVVALVAMGEGWHNYHHVFPWDYKAAELGGYAFNLTTFFLDVFAKVGWAYDLKSPSRELVRRVAQGYGDGSHPRYGDLAGEVPEEEEDYDARGLRPSKERLNADTWPVIGDAGTPELPERDKRT